MEAKPECPEHETEMRFSASNIDQAEKPMLHGKEIDTRFYYCEVEGCDWRYSSSFDKFFNPKELPTSRQGEQNPVSKTRRNLDCRIRDTFGEQCPERDSFSVAVGAHFLRRNQ